MAFCARQVARRAKLAEADERPLPAVGRLAPVGRAAERVETGGVGIGVEPQILDLADTRSGQLRGDEAGQIELEMARLSGCEEAIGRRVIGQKAIAKTRIHFVAALRDGRPDGRSASRTGAQSAVTTPISRPGVALTSASTRGRSSPSTGADTVATSGEWT